MNTAYQAEFADNSRWKNYELVMTQWPVSDHPGQKDFFPPSPVLGAATANTTMETFFQQSLTCMDCHGATEAQSDFMWSLRIEPRASRDNALKTLAPLLAKAGTVLK